MKPRCTSVNKITDFTLVEEWASHQVLDSHIVCDHFKTAAAKLKGLVAAEPDIRRYNFLG